MVGIICVLEKKYILNLLKELKVPFFNWKIFNPFVAAISEFII